MTSGSESDDSVLYATSVELGRDAWVAPNATLTGRVSIDAYASVWFGCVLRGDLAPIAIGDESNVQDLTVIHVDRGCPVVVGKRVTIGHRAVIHGCTIDDDAVICPTCNKDVRPVSRRAAAPTPRHPNLALSTLESAQALPVPPAPAFRSVLQTS